MRPLDKDNGDGTVIPDRIAGLRNIDQDPISKDELDSLLEEGRELARRAYEESNGIDFVNPLFFVD